MHLWVIRKEQENFTSPEFLSVGAMIYKGRPCLTSDESGLIWAELCVYIASFLCEDLATNTGSFAKSVAMLGNAEEHTSLSRALSQLAEVEEKIDQLHMDQADNDFFVLSELIKDYVCLMGAIKVKCAEFRAGVLKTT